MRILLTHRLMKSENYKLDSASRWGQLDFQLFAKSALEQAKIEKTQASNQEQ